MFRIFFVFVACIETCLTISSSTRNATMDKSKANFDKIFPIFYDLNTIMETIESERVHFPELVEELLYTYHNVCMFAPDAPIPEKNRRPFIVVEGNQRSRREVIAKMLADKIGARFLLIPPKCLTKLFVKIPAGSPLRRAFFGLSLYVSAYNVRQLWSLDTPVVMNGYWTDQASFIINKKYSNTWNLPPETDTIYDPPTDLLPPDMIFYLHHHYTQDFNNKYKAYDPNKKPLIWHIYSMFRNPKPFMFNSVTQDKEIVSQLCQYISRHLSHKCDLSYTIPNNIDKI